MVGYNSLVTGSQLVRVAGNNQFEQTHRVGIIEDQCVVGVLECSLHLFDIVGTSPYVYFWVLRIFNAESVSGPFIMAFPAAMAFLKVFASLSNGKPYVLVIELCAIEFQKVYQVFSKVHVISSPTFVLPLQITGDHHCKEERTNTAMISFIELARLEKALKDEEHGPEFGVFLEKLLDELDAVDAVLPVETNVDID